MRITLNEADRMRFGRLVTTQQQNAAVLACYSRFLNRCPSAVEPDAAEGLMAECGIDAQTAYLTLFAALCGLDMAENPVHRQLVERYLRPSIRQLAIDDYRDNPYLNLIRFPTQSSGRWTLRYQQ